MNKKIQHITERENIAAVFGTGKKAKALCGKKFAPSIEGSWERPICKGCARAAGSEVVRPFRKPPASATYSCTFTYTGAVTGWSGNGNPSSSGFSPAA